MTREEALNELLTMLARYAFDADEAQAIGKAMEALRPVSREQVEKMWSGCEHCTNSHARQNLGYQFCEHCGRPITDEAVDMVMERLEGLKDGEGD